MTNLFSEREQDITAGAKGLAKTAEMTAAAAQVVNEVFETIRGNQEQYQAAVIASQSSHDAMDKLLKDIGVVGTFNTSFLSDEAEEELEKMLRSQQSKRSRSKGKVMTMENYKSMMNAAVCELMLRQVLGTSKSAGNRSARSGEIGYSAERLEELAADQEALGKEIRNVQSKKSIAKSKIGFDESSDRWQQLLEAEATLKSLRIGESRQPNKSTEIKALLQDVDISSLKATDAKSLLDNIANMLKATAE